MIDGIITLMDAVFAMRQLDEYEQARQQVGYADRLLISKTDLVSAEDVELLINRLRRINPHASIHTVDFGRIPVAGVLDLRGFNLSSKLDVDADGHDHHHDHDHPHDHAWQSGLRMFPSSGRHRLFRFPQQKTLRSGQTQ